jgi:competence ComEA-like helix-hairpin-helix protein
VASSLIRINEATADELQLLKGIGPKRAERITTFREKVGPVRNAFDLATATGTSVKIAEKISNQIDWHHDGTTSRVNIWPLVITSLTSLWLLAFGFVHLTSSISTTADGLYRLGFSLVLLGSLVATADIALASLKRESSETTRLFLPATTLFLTGFFLLCGLVGLGSLTGLSGTLEDNLRHTFTFVSMTMLMIWLIYGPALCLRAMIGHSPTRVQKARNFYDFSLPVIAATCVYLLLFANGSTWLEEIFSIWSLVIITSNGNELIKGHPAFVTMLTNLDRGRYQFFLRHEVAVLPDLRSHNRLVGSLTMTVAAFLLAALIGSLFT